MRRLLAFALCAGCSFPHGSLGGSDASGDTTSSGDGSGGSGDAATFGTGPFGAATLVAVSGPTYRDDDVTLTGDMLEMFFESDRVVSGDGDIYWSRRASVNDGWSIPVRVDELSTAYFETSTNITSDGLTMYFSSTRPPSSSTDIDIYVSTRPDRDSPWTTPQVVVSLSSTVGEWDAVQVTATRLIMGSNRLPAKGGSDVFRSTRASSAADWGTPTTIRGLDTADYEGEGFEDATGAIWFTGNGNGTQGPYDLWRSAPLLNGSYDKPARISELATSFTESDAWLSPDGHTIYFTSNRAGSLDIYMATR